MCYMQPDMLFHFILKVFAEVLWIEAFFFHIRHSKSFLNGCRFAEGVFILLAIISLPSCTI